MLKVLLKFLLGLFGFGDLLKQEAARGHAEEEGELKAANKQQAEDIHEMQVDKGVSDRIDNMSDADFEQLRAKLNDRPER